jgi:hypothetical protein
MRQAHSGFNIHNEVQIDDYHLPLKRRAVKKWAELIKLVYEVNPLQCPKCHQEMRIVAIINDPPIVERILKHLDLWQPQAHSPPVNKDFSSPVNYSLFHLMLNPF